MNGRARAQPLKPAASSLAPVRGVLQRKCACGGSPGFDGQCAECRGKRLQRRSARETEATAVPPIVHDILRSPGQPLDPATRAFMEPRFGHDFGQVRVHADAKAAESARAVNAAAYTVGRDVVFGAGQYSPEFPAGRRLLAHELTHVMQQRFSEHSPLHHMSDSAKCESEANITAAVVVSGQPQTPRQNISGGRCLAKQELPAPDLDLPSSVVASEGRAVREGPYPQVNTRLPHSGPGWQVLSDPPGGAHVRFGSISPLGPPSSEVSRSNALSKRRALLVAGPG